MGNGRLREIQISVLSHPSVHQPRFDWRKISNDSLDLSLTFNVGPVLCSCPVPGQRAFYTGPLAT